MASIVCQMELLGTNLQINILMGKDVIGSYTIQVPLDQPLRPSEAATYDEDDD